MMTLENDFSWIAANAFSDMRLLAEGAIALFEDETDILSSLARDAGKVEAMIAFNDIGTALYAFRSYIKSCKPHSTGQKHRSLLMSRRLKQKRMVSMTVSKSQKTAEKL